LKFKVEVNFPINRKIFLDIAFKYLYF